MDTGARLFRLPRPVRYNTPHYLQDENPIFRHATTRAVRPSRLLLARRVVFKGGSVEGGVSHQRDALRFVRP